MAETTPGLQLHAKGIAVYSLGVFFIHRSCWRSKIRGATVMNVVQHTFCVANFRMEVAILKNRPEAAAVET